MPGSKVNKKQDGLLCTIVERSLQECINTANERGVTKDEFVHITPIPAGYVLVYYR